MESEEAMATNASAVSFLQEAAAQATGLEQVAELTYDNVVQEAGAWSMGQKEQFISALSCQYADTYYTDSAWLDKYGDLYFQDSEEFGAIVQIINTEMPQIRQNRAWETITSGTTTIGSNVVYLPVVEEQLAGGTCSWAVPYAITGTQMNAAFKDASGLRRFDTFLKLAAENSSKFHISRMTAANRNNYIISKLAVGNTTGKINVVNLVAEYNATFNANLTAAQFLANTNGCLRQVNRMFKKYKALLTDMTTFFTLKDYSGVDSDDDYVPGKFIPEDRFTFSVLGDFVGLLESELYSTTFHDTFVTLKGYREVPFWQAPRGSSNTATFPTLSYINGRREASILDDEGISASQSGVVGLMVDKWAIMHTIVRHRTGVQRDDIKDITLFEHQYTDRYINNLMLNGVVFIVADPS